MFPPAYFPVAYFPPEYFPPGAEVVQEVIDALLGLVSVAPSLGASAEVAASLAVLAALQRAFCDERGSACPSLDSSSAVTQSDLDGEASVEPSLD